MNTTKNSKQGVCNCWKRSTKKVFDSHATSDVRFSGKQNPLRGTQHATYEAEQALKELKDWSTRSYVPPYFLAEVYIGLGDKRQALAMLEKAYADRSMFLPTYLKVDPELDSLHADPRFKDLVRRVGLPQ